MKIYRIVRRPRTGNQVCRATSASKTYLTLESAVRACRRAQRENDNWAELGAPDHEYRVQEASVVDWKDLD